MPDLTTQARVFFHLCHLNCSSGAWEGFIFKVCKYIPVVNLEAEEINKKEKMPPGVRILRQLNIHTLPIDRKTG